MQRADEAKKSTAEVMRRFAPRSRYIVRVVHPNIASIIVTTSSKKRAVQVVRDLGIEVGTWASDGKPCVFEDYYNG